MAEIVKEDATPLADLSDAVSGGRSVKVRRRGQHPSNQD
jgi:hypothetical protein